MMVHHDQDLSMKITTRESMDKKLDNDYDAFVLALTLAITAESDERYEQVVPMLESLGQNFDAATIERAKKESIERVKELDALNE